MREVMNIENLVFMFSIHAIQQDKDGKNGSGDGVTSYQNNAYADLTDGEGYETLDDAKNKHDYASLKDPDGEKDGNANLSDDGNTGALGVAGGGTQDGTGDATGGGSGGGADKNRGSLIAPVIVTSPASDSKNTGQRSTPSTPGSTRRGSASIGGSEGQGSGSKPSSPVSLRRINADRERRRSSVHSTLEDEADPLTHKTATVGIVALALRNKNEKKKETEFKVGPVGMGVGVGVHPG